MKCANCGMPIVECEDGYTHIPDRFIVKCRYPSPTKTPWWEIQPKDPDLLQCRECAAVVLRTGMARHQEWHSQR